MSQTVLARLQTEPDDPFDPAHFAALARPWQDAETLPAWCYTSERVWRREIDRIFRRTWQCLGPESRLARPGDYLPVEVAGTPLILARDLDGGLHAFANYCRHRGSRLIEAPGNGRFLKCPYHAWAYALDGSLAGAPLVEDDAHFRRADHPLLAVRLERWAGLIWINLDPDAPSLMDYLGDLPARCAPWALDRMVCTWRREYDLKANWKLYYENFNEAYHIPFVHPSSLSKQHVPKRTLYEAETPGGEYIVHFTKHTGSRAVMPGDTGFGRLPWLPESPETEGTFYPTVNPNVMFGMTVDSAWLVELHPHAPDHTTIAVSMLFPPETVARPDFAAIAPNYYKRFDVTVPEDMKAAEDQQIGLASPFAAPGRYTAMEQLVLAFDRWWVGRMVGNRA